MNTDLLSCLCLGFFFSAFFFSDTLWSTVREELSQRPSFSADEAASSIIHAVCHSLPLITTSLHDLITILEVKHPYLLNHIVARFLAISFEVWWNHTGDGVGFVSGDKILLSLRGIADGSTLDITSALVGSLGECPVLPSFTGFCSMASETLIVSGCDCHLLVTALRPVGHRLPMFDALEKLADQAGADRFAPFAMKFFGNASTRECIYPKLFPIPEIEHLRCELDPIFERACYQKADLKSEEFLRYSLSKSAVRYYELAIDQEIAFTLKQQFDVASDLQRTLFRLRKSFYAEWVAAQSIDISAHPVESATSFLCGNREDLFVPTVLQFTNKVVSPKIPQDLLDACLIFSRTRFQSIWTRAAAIGQNPLIQRRVPLVAGRPSITWSQIFNLFSHLFEEIRTIVDRLFDGERSLDLFIVILQTVFISANTDRIFKVFLVFEKTLFRQAEFVRVLEKATLNNWTQFFRMMLTTLAEDQPLLNRCISFDLSDSAFA